MRWLRLLLSRARGLLAARHQDQDIQDQIRAHLEESTEEFIRQGLSPAEARRAARLSFGSIVHAEEACRDARGRWHEDLSKDVHYGWRLLRRDPAFATVAVFSVVRGKPVF